MSKPSERSDTDRLVVIVAPNISLALGGEALKAQKYVETLLSRGQRLAVITHARCRNDVRGLLPEGVGHFVEDDWIQRFLWRSVVLRFALSLHFHAAARRRLARIARDSDPIVHYVSPISPLEPRLVPAGMTTVIGPLNGNITYPPAFLGRVGWISRLHTSVYGLASTVMAAVLRRERMQSVLLVSGGKRTIDTLGPSETLRGSVIEVADSGVSAEMMSRELVVHSGRNAKFYTCARLIDLKGVDLAIKAVARSDHDVTFDIIGEGPSRPRLEELAASLGVADRVRFRGWIRHSDLANEIRQFRGFVFPSLAEANGIAMQEAMTCGLPAISLRWGGPEQLADAGSAILVDPDGEEEVVAGLATAMNRLAGDADLANGLARNARRRTEKLFDWNVVADSWGKAYSLAANLADERSGAPRTCPSASLGSLN